MIDAFSILGAKPTDKTERLQELLEEKELILDDVSEAQAAYADLTNPKKRLKHEIMYFCANDFVRFNQMIVAEKKYLATEHAKILVELGHWFEDDKFGLFEKINENRHICGYVQIDNDGVFWEAIEEIKNEFVATACAYFDSLKLKRSWVLIFNAIVQMPDFASFFVDELMAHYELAIDETLQEKEKICRDRFSEIEKICLDFNNGAPLSSSLSWIVATFGEELKDWDRCAQPLQKNAQVRGGQHENSEKLVHEIRNRVIELCNSSQEKLMNWIVQLNKCMSIDFYPATNEVKVKLQAKISDSLRLTDALIQIIDILRQVFLELEITAEQLLQDKKELRELKNVLIKLNAPLEKEKIEREQEEKEAKRSAMIWRIIQGVFTLICLIVMTVGFSVHNIALGVGFLVPTIAFGCCCGFYHLLEDTGMMKWIIIAGVIMGGIAGGVLASVH